jgi:hypothetical protein
MMGPRRPNVLAAALAIGQRFAPVFPTVDGRPRCAHGVHDATRDPERIKALWAGCPGANVSAAMGRVSGLLGLDVDMKGGRDGMASLAALEAKHGPLPPTPCYATPSDGLGYLFQHPGGAVPTRFDFASGLELHSDGAAMTLPPSAKKGRLYRWLVTPRDVPIAEVPSWLLEAARPPPPSPPRREQRPLRIDSFDRLARYAAKALDEECGAVARMGKDSGRNRALFIAAAKLGELIGAGVLPRGLVEADLEDAAIACGLLQEDGSRSVRATIQSGLTRGLAHPREIAA